MPACFLVMGCFLLWPHINDPSFFWGSKDFIHKSLQFISASITMLLGMLSYTSLSTPFIGSNLAAKWVVSHTFCMRTKQKKLNLGMKDLVSPKRRSTREFACFPASMHCSDDIWNFHFVWNTCKPNVKNLVGAVSCFLGPCYVWAPPELHSASGSDLALHSCLTCLYVFIYFYHSTSHLMNCRLLNGL